MEFAALKNLASAELELIRVEKEIDAYLAENVPKAMPNVSYLVDYKIAAELLSRAGSLTKLALMPSSTIQLLGAEKALFRHIRSGSRAPKYGVLFRLKDVTVAERWNKGKVARMFAAKLSIAARADAFSKRFIADTLKAALEKSLANMPAEKSERQGLPIARDERRRPREIRREPRMSRGEIKGASIRACRDSKQGACRRAERSCAQAARGEASLAGKTL